MTNLDTAVKNIKSAKRVAILLPEEISVDVLCAGIALQDMIKNLGNSADIFSSAENILNPTFLTNQPDIKNSFSKGDQLTIKISNKNAEAKEIKYDKESDGLAIIVTAKESRFKDEDVIVLPNINSFDLVIIVCASNLESLGKLYNQNTKLFFEIPILNIDINFANEYFGTVNIVEPTVNSVCEIVFDIAHELNVNLQEDIKTVLLAGIISQTASFRDPKTTPASLQKASSLVAGGAKQQDIIQYLFKTKPLQQIQLWGRTLARLVEYPEKRIVTSFLTTNDIQKTGNNYNLLPAVLKDLIEMINSYSLIVLLVESGKILIAGLPHEDILGIAKELSGSEINFKNNHLVGQYDYLVVDMVQPLEQTQQKLNDLIQKR